MVIDTSVIISIIFEEEHCTWAIKQLNENRGSLSMSTVNLAETLIIIRDKQPTLYDEIEKRILTLGIRFVPPDVLQAKIVAQARVNFPVNLGDCFAYALAVVTHSKIITLDNDFRSLDCQLLIPLKRNSKKL